MEIETVYSRLKSMAERIKSHAGGSRVLQEEKSIVDGMLNELEQTSSRLKSRADEVRAIVVSMAAQCLWYLEENFGHGHADHEAPAKEVAADISVQGGGGSVPITTRAPLSEGNTSHDTLLISILLKTEAHRMLYQQERLSREVEERQRKQGVLHPAVAVGKKEGADELRLIWTVHVHPLEKQEALNERAAGLVRAIRASVHSFYTHQGPTVTLSEKPSREP